MVVFSACLAITNGMDIVLAYRYFDIPFVWRSRYSLIYIFFRGLGFIFPSICGVLGLLASKSVTPNTFIAWHYILVHLLSFNLKVLKKDLQIFSLYFSVFWDFLLE